MYIDISIYRCEDTGTPGRESVLDSLYCMLQQRCAIGLQTDCMMAVTAPWRGCQTPMCMPYGPRLWVATL